MEATPALGWVDRISRQPDGVRDAVPVPSSCRLPSARRYSASTEPGTGHSQPTPASVGWVIKYTPGKP